MFRYGFDAELQECVFEERQFVFKIIELRASNFCAALKINPIACFAVIEMVDASFMLLTPSLNFLRAFLAA